LGGGYSCDWIEVDIASRIISGVAGFSKGETEKERTSFCTMLGI
jgi:hypothetical protein